MTRFHVAIIPAGLLSLVSLAACSDRSDPTTVPPPTTASSRACIASQPLPPSDLPWKTVAQLCDSAPRGAPWQQAAPPLGPDWVQQTDAYAERVQTFLRDLAYRSPPYDWLRDAHWRMTGPYEGCPPDGINKGPHPAVRIYYSPEVIDWMCTYRRGEDQLPDARDLPAGAMIVKEMIEPSKVTLARVPETDELWIAPMPGQPASYYDDSFDAWTVMIKAPEGSTDGWYWGYFSRTGEGNPPLWDRAGFGQQPYPGQHGAPVTSPPEAKWYPTMWEYSTNDVQFPNYGFGTDCLYCHASAQGEASFASFVNLLGDELRYRWIPQASTATDHAAQGQQPAEHPAKPVDVDPGAPFPSPRTAPLPGFRETFPELDPPYSEVWASRLPAQTWDHVVSTLGTGSAAPSQSQFLTSDQCQVCHAAGGAVQVTLPNMVVQTQAGTGAAAQTAKTAETTDIDLSAWAEWSASPMGLAGRNPIFHAQLELERNLARQQPGLATIRDCIDNTCLHCHGAAGARQYNIDTAGQGPTGDPCAAFLPARSERAATHYDGKLFTQDELMAWRDENPAMARYGGLARDGINCTICHRVADVDLDPSSLSKTFTGNYRVGPPDKLYGPFPHDGSKEEVRTKPMENALGITPELGAQIATSELCGTCHTVVLPVFDDRGALAASAYEQTTYLEWLLSAFGPSAGAKGQTQNRGKSCQDCHMPGTHGKKQLQTGIANIQDTRYPAAEFLLPSKDVDIPERPYKRHQLYGLNAFLGAYFQQFPLLLGYRQFNFMNGKARAPLLTARESVLEVARHGTGQVSVSDVAWRDGALEARVTVTNLSGHNLPSGVGFRRLFVEFLVLDDAGQPLWASGRTNEIGVIVRGTGSAPLPTEFWGAGPDGLPFQPHHQIITGEDQVQIYEEATQSSSRAFTSSFLHRYWKIKDNRLRPRGYDPAREEDPGRRAEYGDATKPGAGPARHGGPRPARREPYRNPQFPAIQRYTDTQGDPQYDLRAHGASGLPGSDSLTYRITLSPELRARARTVQATLHYQSTPPHYLKERFVQAAKKDAERSAAQRLYFMSGHLNTDARADDGSAYLAGYKLRVGAPATRPVPAP